MKTSTIRLLELAIKGLELEKNRIDAEIADLSSQLKGIPRAAKAAGASEKAEPARKRKREVRISAEESQRRSERMRQYWIDWRKKKAAGAKGKAKTKKA